MSIKPAAIYDGKKPARYFGSNREDESRHDGMLPPQLVREQLSRVLHSPIFSLSTRLVRFLQFVVETSLAGEGHTLKEYVIGTEVYDRKPPYHPSQDSIVRTEARRLRSKLKEYYETEGTADPILIYFRTGSYVPVFSSRQLLNIENAPGQAGNDSSAARKLDILIVVVPFEALSGGTLAKECVRAITEGLKHRFTMGEARPRLC
jgi:hypothetical protein